MLLIVDDEEFIVEVLEALITSINADIPIIRAYDGLEALKLYKTHKDEINFILTDVKMKSMGGLELLKEVNDLGSPPMACIMSGYMPEVDHLSYSNKLLTISKPFNQQELKKILSEVL